jgi:hypothetical protein
MLRCVCCHAVPVCAPGQELDLDLLVCYGCQGNTVSPGGRVTQGTMQPRCEECPWGTAANETHRVCYTGTHSPANTSHNLTQLCHRGAVLSRERQHKKHFDNPRRGLNFNSCICCCFCPAGTCPFPDNFRITCRKDNLLGATSYPLCGPNAKATSVNQYCTAYPPGSVLAWYEPRTFTTNDRVTQETSCPAGANSSSVKYPAIISFNGRTDCLCTSTNCYFEGGSRILVPGVNVTIPGGQKGPPGRRPTFLETGILENQIPLPCTV